MKEQIRKVIGDHANLDVELSRLDDGDDLYAAGMTSHASVSVMVALEDEFDLEFPDAMLNREVFESIASIESALTEIQKA